MTKETLIRKVAQKTNFPVVHVKIALETFLDTIKEAVRKGENVSLRKFGTFRKKKRAAKLARNISKNTPMMVKAVEVPHFKPSPLWGAMVRNGQK